MQSVTGFLQRHQLALKQIWHANAINADLVDAGPTDASVRDQRSISGPVQTQSMANYHRHAIALCAIKISQITDVKHCS
jgi:hypothetical protein